MPNKQLDPQDTIWVAKRLPRWLRDMMKRSPSAMYVAGGFVRDCIAGDTPSDIDIFCCTEEAARAYAAELRDELSCTMHKSENAITLKTEPRVQFITRWTFETVDQLLDSFDFTVAQAAVWWTGSNWNGRSGQHFYRDLAARRLTYTSPVRDEEPGGSMLRLLKFHSRGYTDPLESTAAVMARILRGVDQEKIDRLPVELREAETTRVLTALLVAVDPTFADQSARDETHLYEGEYFSVASVEAPDHE